MVSDSTLAGRMALGMVGAQGVFSPVSAYIALGNLLLASSGATRQELAELMGWADIEEAERDVVAAAHTLRIRPDEISLANALFHGPDTRLCPGGVEALRAAFGTNVGQAWGEDREMGARFINAWTREATQGRISEIVDKIYENDQVILVNALTFDAQWSRPFRAVLEPQPFRGRSGLQRVAMMSRADHTTGFVERERDDVVELRYVQSDFVMRIHVPHRGSAREWMQQLREEDWATPIPYVPANLTMPLFTLKSSMDLSSLIPQKLRSQADFSLLVDSATPLVFPKMRQQSWLEVDLFGTKAAAATGVYIRSACDRPRPIDLRIEEPFAFSIRHVPTRRAIFTGWVDDFL